MLLPQLLKERRPEHILHFAPEPILASLFSAPELRYETTDRFLQDVDYPGVDIQRLPFADRSYDLVLANHVLEHVPDDKTALSELARILTHGGCAVITVPGDFSKSETTYFTGDLPNGHYRDYGRDFIERLHGSFPAVTVVEMCHLDPRTRGLSAAIRSLDLAFVCEVTPGR